MRTLQITFLSLIFLSLSLYAESSAEGLFDQKCASCHIKTKPINKAALTSPPIMGVMYHVKKRYKTKEKAVNFITDYVMNPQKQKAVCKDNKIERFGLMPSQKGNLTETELRIIAEWIYDTFPPLGFRGMDKSKSCGK